MGARIYFADKICLHCATPFNRKRLRGGRWEDTSDFKSRKYCSRKCYGLNNRGENHALYINGKRKRPDGYIRFSDDRYEHRVVMENMLGRPLKPHEHVHHINHDPSDNRPENLELSTYSEHRKHHAKTQKRDEFGAFCA